MKEIEKMHKFADPTMLFLICEEKLKRLGAEKFLKSSLQEAHKAKEAFFAYFFILALKAGTKRDYWLYQPDSFPDLKLVSFADSVEKTDAHEFELVTIVPECASYEEALSIVQNKLRKGYSITNEKLLIFVNHKSADTWVKRLGNEFVNGNPFKEIWTCHLYYDDTGSTVKHSVAHKLYPKPVYYYAANTDDSRIFVPNLIPSALEEIEIDGIKYLGVKKEFSQELRKRSLKKRLGKN